MSKKEKKAAVSEEEKAEKEASVRVDLYEWIQSLMTALVICMAVFIFCVRTIDVSGSSMFPTLHDGDKMLVSNLLYKPKAGDIVVFKTDNYDPNRALVKRVIATEGQEISIDFDRGIVYIDGLPKEEDYIAELTRNKLDFIGVEHIHVIEDALALYIQRVYADKRLGYSQEDVFDIPAGFNPCEMDESDMMEVDEGTSIEEVFE